MQPIEELNSKSVRIEKTEHKAVWETPRLKTIGKMRDFIQGIKGSKNGDGEGIGAGQMMA